jgi:hypothetical protein
MLDMMTAPFKPEAVANEDIELAVLAVEAASAKLLAALRLVRNHPRCPRHLLVSASYLDFATIQLRNGLREFDKTEGANGQTTA